MNKDSIREMFGESAGCVENDMRRIVGAAPVGPAAKKYYPLSLAECTEMNALLATQGKGGRTQAHEDRMKFLHERYLNAGGVCPPAPSPDPEGNGTVNGSMLDFSSPINTIVKSLFLLSLTPMFSGSNDFYFLSVGCSGAIIYSLFKLINR